MMSPWAYTPSILQNETGLCVLVSCLKDHHHSQLVSVPWKDPE